jgi:hypothetical protein
MIRRPSMIAADALAGAPPDPDVLASILRRVDPGRVKIRVGPIWFRPVWGRRISAIALPWGIYVRPQVMERMAAGSEPVRNTRLVVHELVHIEQWRRFGPVGLLRRYLSDYLVARLRRKSHWDAYRGVRTEVEARAAARLVASGIDGP